MNYIKTSVTLIIIIFSYTSNDHDVSDKVIIEFIFVININTSFSTLSYKYNILCMTYIRWFLNLDHLLFFSLIMKLFLDFLNNYT